MLGRLARDNCSVLGFQVGMLGTLEASWRMPHCLSSLLVCYIAAGSLADKTQDLDESFCTCPLAAFLAQSTAA